MALFLIYLVSNFGLFANFIFVIIYLTEEPSFRK